MSEKPEENQIADHGEENGDDKGKSFLGLSKTTWAFVIISAVVIKHLIPVFQDLSPDELANDAEAFFELKAECLTEISENRRTRPAEIPICRDVYMADAKLRKKPPEHFVTFFRDAFDAGLSFRTLDDEWERHAPAIRKLSDDGNAQAKRLLTDIVKVRLRGNPSAASSSESDLERLSRVGADIHEISASIQSGEITRVPLWYELPVRKIAFRTIEAGAVSVYLEFPRFVTYGDIVLALKENRNFGGFRIGPRGNQDGDGMVDGHSLKITRMGGDPTKMFIYDDPSFKDVSRKFMGYVETWAANRCRKEGGGWETCADKTGWLGATIAK